MIIGGDTVSCIKPDAGSTGENSATSKSGVLIEANSEPGAPTSAACTCVGSSQTVADVDCARAVSRMTDGSSLGAHSVTLLLTTVGSSPLVPCGQLVRTRWKTPDTPRINSIFQQRFSIENGQGDISHVF